jgi:hypothetical protein
MTRVAIYGLAIVVLFALSAAAADPVTFKSAIPQAGQRIRITVDEKSKSLTSFTIMGNTQNKEEAKTKTIVYVDEVLEIAANGGKPVKLKRTYEKAVASKDGVETKLPWDGKTIVIEKKNDKYTFTMDGEDASGDALKLLDAEFNKATKTDNQDFFMPKKPVQVGDSWKVDAADLLKVTEASGMVLDKDKATAKATLTKLYNKDKAQFGTTEFAFDAPVTGLGMKSPLVVQEGKMTIKSIDDGCFDGSTPVASRTTKVKVTLSGSVKGIDLKIEGDNTESRKIELLK